MCRALLALSLLFAACGGSQSAPARGPIAFTEVVTAQSSRYDGDAAAVMVGASASATASIAVLVPQASAPPGRMLVAAFQGGQRTGGYAIRITSIERDGDRILVHALFTEPAPSSLVTQILTSPAHVVAIAQADAAGAHAAVLLDSTGAERARATLP